MFKKILFKDQSLKLPVKSSPRLVAQINNEPMFVLYLNEMEWTVMLFIHSRSLPYTSPFIFHHPTFSHYKYTSFMILCSPWTFPMNLILYLTYCTEIFQHNCCHYHIFLKQLVNHSEVLHFLSVVSFFLRFNYPF